MNMEALDLIDQAARDYVQIMRSLEASMTPAWCQVDLTPAEFKALNMIASRGTLTVGGLAALLKSSKSWTSQLVQRLVEHDLVSRIDDSEDRRYTWLHLTRAGQDALDLAYPWREHALSRLVAQLPRSELITLASGLQSLRLTLTRPSGVAQQRSAS
jgi:DNA-binding MarR family transcriptional regulator